MTLFCLSADYHSFVCLVGDHTFVCEVMTTLLSVGRWPLFCLCSRWPHFCLWTDYLTFLCEQMTTLCLWADDLNFVCEQMTTLFYRGRSMYKNHTGGRWPCTKTTLLSLWKMMKILFCDRWQQFCLWTYDHTFICIQMTTLLYVWQVNGTRRQFR